MHFPLGHLQGSSYPLPAAASRRWNCEENKLYNLKDNYFIKSQNLTLFSQFFDARAS